jgi:hypothetical protein
VISEVITVEQKVKQSGSNVFGEVLRELMMIIISRPFMHISIPDPHQSIQLRSR